MPVAAIPIAGHVAGAERAALDPPRGLVVTSVIDDPRDLLRVLLGGGPDLWPRTEPAWARLVDQVASLSAEGLLHAAVRRAGDGAEPPPAIRDRLRRAHAATAAKNLELVAEADRVLAALACAGVVAAPMKGTALFREGIVRDLGTRATTDVDLAISRADRDVSLAVLAGLGYAPSRGERSWKHLTPMRRGDLAIELHEIAWWSGRSRAAFGARHLTIADRTHRLARLWALQVHHLVLGSPPDAALLVRTLADVAAFADRARAEPPLAARALEAAAEAGLEQEMLACDAIVAGAQGAPPSLGGRASRAAIDRLLAPLVDPTVDPRLAVLTHFLRTAHRQPLAVSAATVVTLLQPPPSSAGDAPSTRTRRALQLGLRVAAVLPRALRELRRGAGARSPHGPSR